MQDRQGRAQAALRTAPYRVWGRGIGSEMHRKGSKVLLCFWQ